MTILAPHLAVSFGRTYLNQPLAIVHNLPGGDAELQPAQLRALAAALLAAAQDCESHHAELGSKGIKGIGGSREYTLTGEGSSSSQLARPAGQPG